MDQRKNNSNERLWLLLAVSFIQFRQLFIPPATSVRKDSKDGAVTQALHRGYVQNSGAKLPDHHRGGPVPRA